MKTYQTPKFEVKEFFMEDIVTTSNVHDQNAVLFKDGFDEYASNG